MTDRIFRYDYFCLGDVDPDEWQHSFFWPVARKTTTRITIDFKAEHCSLIEDLGNNRAGDMLMIGYHISGRFIQVVNHLLALHRLKQKGYRVEHSDRLTLIPLLLTENEPIRFAPEDLFTLAKRSRRTTAYRDLLSGLKFNFKRGRFNLQDQFRSGSNIYAFHNENVKLREYTTRQKRWIRCTSPEEWLGGTEPADHPPSLTDRFSAIADRLVRFAEGYTREQFDFQIPQPVQQALFRFAIDTLVHIAAVYAVIEKRVRRIEPRRMLTPTAGKTFTRALSTAVRNNGGEVTGFPHGYYICHYSSPRPTFHELATVDRFAAYSPGSVPLMKRNLAINPPPRGHRVEIVHDNSPDLKNHFKTFSRKRPPQRHRKIMVLELSLLPEWAGYHAAEAMVNYHFYYTLCKYLVESGYEVIFKRRPKDYSWEGINLFGKLPNFTIEYEPFEKPGVIDQADAVIIQYAMSSTLFWAMCTNKTVIYVDAGWEPWFEEVYASMAKRCRVLRCWYDENNRQCFDRQELLQLLEAPPVEPDTEFMNQYLFPS